MGLITTMIKTKQSNDISREKLEKIQNERLKKLVLYAKKNSEFYAEKFKDIGDYFKLSDLPMTTKPEMMNAFDSDSFIKILSVSTG